MVLFRVSVLLFASTAIYADPALVWDDNLTGSSTCVGADPSCEFGTLTTDGFVMAAGDFALGNYTSVDASSAESFTVTTPGSFILNETVALQLSGQECTAGGCRPPNGLSGSYSASNGLSGSNAIPPGNFQEGVINFGGATTQILDLADGTYSIGVELSSEAESGDPGIEGTFTVSVVPTPEPRFGFALAALLFGAVPVLRRQRLRGHSFPTGTEHDKLCKGRTSMVKLAAPK